MVLSVPGSAFLGEWGEDSIMIQMRPGSECAKKKYFIDAQKKVAQN